MCLWLYPLPSIPQQVAACRGSERAFPATVLQMPADIRVASFRFASPSHRKCPDLAPLTRLAHLEELSLYSPIHHPIPQLPALRTLRVVTSDLWALSPVAATLESLDLVAPFISFGQPYTLAHFTRLNTLHVDAHSICNFTPEVLPSTLRNIRLGYAEHAMHPDDVTWLEEALVPIFPACGTIDRNQDDGHLIHGGHEVVWLHNSV